MTRDCAKLFSDDLQIMQVVPSHVMHGRWGESRTKDKQQFGNELRADAVLQLLLIMKELILPRNGILQGTTGEMICSVAGEGTYDMIVRGARNLSYCRMCWQRA